MPHRTKDAPKVSTRSFNPSVRESLPKKTETRRRIGRIGGDPIRFTRSCLVAPLKCSPTFSRFATKRFNNSSCGFSIIGIGDWRKHSRRILSQLTTGKNVIVGEVFVKLTCMKAWKEPSPAHTKRRKKYRTEYSLAHIHALISYIWLQTNRSRIVRRRSIKPLEPLPETKL